MDGVGQNAVFVRLNEYKDALIKFKELKENIISAREMLEKIEALRHEEKTEIELWERNITEIQTKIESIDKFVLGVNQ